MKRAAIAALLLSACGGRAVSEPAPAAAAPEPQPDQPRVVARTELSHADAIGLSGLCRTDGRHFLAVPERRKSVLELDERGVVGARPLRGVPEDVDVEGIAALGDDLFLATEGVGERRSDAVLWARLGAEGYQVTQTLPVVVKRRQGQEPLVLDDNAGLEGICIADEMIFAAVETVVEREGRRAAPVVSLSLPLDDEDEKDERTYFVALTSDTGKLSGLDCRADDDGFELLAIERHFGVSRLLRFRIDEGTRSLVEPELVADLLPLLVRGENFEGIAALGNGRVALVNDNDYGEIQGPSELVIVDLPALRGD